MTCAGHIASSGVWAELAMPLNLGLLHLGSRPPVGGPAHSGLEDNGDPVAESQARGPSALPTLDPHTLYGGTSFTGEHG